MTIPLGGTASRQLIAVLLLFLPGWGLQAQEPRRSPSTERLRPMGSGPDMPREREEMTGRALQYLADQVKGGRLGDSRPKAVTALFILSALSAGVTPDEGKVGKAVTDAAKWLISQSAGAGLGGTEEPHSDHALVALALQQLVGVCGNADFNRILYRKSLEALQYSLEIQDKGSQPEHTGGWTPNPQTTVNDRMLTSWFLLQLHGAGLWQAKISRSNVRRASAFVLASQKGPDAPKEDERGGFSVGADGLAVRSSSAAGAFVLSLNGSDPDKLAAANAWLKRHPPRWYGPDFFNTNFFAGRALWRGRQADGGATYNKYFSKLTRLLRERQQSNGSFPFPPGHGGPIVAMGPAYSTAMAILILNLDRGRLPLDQ